MSEFEQTVGIAYLRGLHLNDARTTLGSKKDRHENIGLYVLVTLCLPEIHIDVLFNSAGFGFHFGYAFQFRMPLFLLSWRICSGPLALAFRAALTDHRTRDLPLILETPSYGTEMDADGIWAAEIKVLYRMAHLPALSTEPGAVSGNVEGNTEGGLCSREKTEDQGMNALAEEMRATVAAVKTRGDGKSLRKGKEKKICTL